MEASTWNGTRSHRTQQTQRTPLLRRQNVADSMRHAPMRRIAAIVAPNYSYANTGMVSVDLALHSLCANAPTATEIGWFSLHRATETSLRDSIDERELP